jgi:hypothetical protein
VAAADSQRAPAGAGAGSRGLSLAEWLLLCLVREQPTYGQALGDQLRATTGFERTLVLGRHKSLTATMRFLEGLTGSVPQP